MASHKLSLPLALGVLILASLVYLCLTPCSLQTGSWCLGSIQRYRMTDKNEMVMVTEDRRIVGLLL